MSNNCKKKVNISHLCQLMMCRLWPRRLLSSKASAASTIPPRGTWSVRGDFEEAHRVASAVSAEQLAELCRLAHVAPPADAPARERLQRDLGLMLTFVQRVQAAAPPDAPPLVSVSRAVPARRSGDDVAPAADAAPLPRDVLLANAPATRDGFFLVADQRERDEA